MATTQTGFAVASIDDVEQGATGAGREVRRVRHHFGIEAFGVNAMRATEAGAEVINEHSEVGVGTAGQEELYVVLEGHARFTVDGDEVDAPTGTLVFVPPGVRRAAVAEEAGTTVLAIGGAPGVAYNKTPGWIVAPMFVPYGEGDFAGAAAKVKEILAEHAGMPLALYNLACCESRLGQTDDALEHLAQAIAGEDGFASFARGDDDFDALRGHKRFQELVG